MRLLVQALAVLLAVVGHSFIFMAATADTPVIAVACAVSVVGVWTAAWLLWTRAMP